jgi:hypothetical protein
LPLDPSGSSVDKADEIAVIEISKAVHFVDGRNHVAEPRHDLCGQLEAEIHALGANVEEQVAGRRDCMARSGPDFAERMQLCRVRSAKESIPRIRSYPHDAGKISLNVAEADGAQ